MIVLWFPIAIFIIFKIIFMANNMDWSKTAHGNTQFVKIFDTDEKKEIEAEQLTKV